MVTHEGAREGVVGGDGGLGGLLRVGDEAGGRESAEPGGDALRQLGGGPAGEGQAEDLVGGDLAPGDEVDDALAHGGGLAAAGARDDEEGAERVRDDAGLLGRRRRQAEGLGEPVGRRRAHEAVLLPSGTAGQESLTMQRAQCAPVRAVSRAPRASAAAEATSSRAQSRPVRGSGLSASAAPLGARMVSPSLSGGAPRRTSAPPATTYPLVSRARR